VRVSNKFPVAIPVRNLQVVKSSLNRAGETTNFVLEVRLNARQLRWLWASLFRFKNVLAHISEFIEN
jgi:hypothetical protein